MKDILFYFTSDEPYGKFSNLARGYPIEIDGLIWPTVENYYQAAKYVDIDYRTQIRSAQPRAAIELGRKPKGVQIRSDWNDEFKLQVMRKAVRAKFTQHAGLRDLLLSTGDAFIAEHGDKDDFWGDGGDGHGQNWLGRILMELRDELKQHANE